VQIFIHDVVPPGPLRQDDAAMDQDAQNLSGGLHTIPGLTFPGARLFIERVDGVDQGLVVIEDAFYNNKEFPTAAELDTLESALKTFLQQTEGFSSVGVVRFHCLTIPVPPGPPPE